MELKHITAEKMKLMIMMQQRFGNGALICATECGMYSSDVLVLTKDGEMVEYETKISLSDFKADFKKPKHQMYEHVRSCEQWDKKFSFVPHKFFFVIPEGLVSEVLPKLMGKPYGVIAIADKPYNPTMRDIHMRVIKRATAIRKHSVTAQEKNIMIKRLTSELINEKIKSNLRKAINEDNKATKEEKES